MKKKKQVDDGFPQIELFFSNTMINTASSALTSPSRSSRKTSSKFNDSWNRGLAQVGGSDQEGRDEPRLVTLICAGLSSSNCWASYPRVIVICENWNSFILDSGIKDLNSFASTALYMDNSRVLT